MVVLDLELLREYALLHLGELEDVAAGVGPRYLLEVLVEVLLSGAVSVLVAQIPFFHIDTTNRLRIIGFYLLFFDLHRKLLTLGLIRK